MQLIDFDFELPEVLIARHPLAERSASRLLCLDEQGELKHRQFKEVLDLLNAGDLLVLNNTKVIPARLFGQKTTGGQVEVLVERVLDNERILAQLRLSKAPRPGDYLLFPGNVRLEIVCRGPLFYELRYNQGDRSILAVIESLGQIPLPHYMHRLPDESDKERYQTVYAKHKGSVAAPTAGLHFDEALLKKIQDKNINIAYLTLHIGAGTFAPVRVEKITEHKMHAEYLEVSEALALQIQATKAAGKRVIAVGTTSARALEAAAADGIVKPYYGDTQIFIYPGYTFRAVDALITNLHLPRSTLLMLVCAFGGYENVMRAYRTALASAYRFYSYGDAMWVPSSGSGGL